MKIVKIIESISQAVNTVATGVLAAMVALTAADVFLRYAFRRPILGTTELTEFGVLVLGFLGLAWCAVKGGHLKVDLVMSRFSPRLQAIVNSFTYLAGLVVCIIIAWRSFLEAMELKRLNLVSDHLEVPHFPFYLVLALGVALLCLVMLTHLIQNVTKAVKG